MEPGAENEGAAPAQRRWLLALALVLTSMAFVAYRLATHSPPLASSVVVGGMEPLDVYGTVPSFAFTTQENVAFTDKDMLGHISIANFIFTRCPTVCPVFRLKPQRIAEPATQEIELISFSVDPEYDTPLRLAEFAKDYQADPKRWHFLPGDHKEVQALVEGALKISMEKEGEDEDGVPDIVHGGHFVLFDGTGSIRGYYNSDDASRIAALLRDAEALRNE